MMTQLLNPLRGPPPPLPPGFFHQFYYRPPGSPALLPPPQQPSCSLYGNATAFGSRGDLPLLLLGSGGSPSCRFQFRVLCQRMLDSAENHPAQSEAKICDDDSNLLHVQTLRKFPMEKLYGEVVIVRFDSTLLLETSDLNNMSVNRALSTIKYLYNAGAKVLLVSNWGRFSDHILLSTRSVADYLSSILLLKVVPGNGVSGFRQSNTKGLGKADILLYENLTKFREELANCLEFSKKLSSGVGIFVNDAFSVSHKILASTVGIARFCYASVAGFHLEEELQQLAKAVEATRRPYIAIVGGGNFLEKRTALRLLAYKCDGLVFVGMLAFQIMHALGLSVPSSLVEHGATGEVFELVQLAHNRNIQILFPNDIWCVNNHLPEMLDIFPADGILTGWTPLDLGPISLKEIYSLLSNCKKVLWIGPVRFGSIRKDTQGASRLALMLEEISGTGCEVVMVGNAAYNTFVGTGRTANSLSSFKYFENASVVWKFLKGQTLPGVAALDREYPFDLDWDSIFSDPTQPLIVDIGSGNGLFLLRMARRWKGSNFLGLDINRKLVGRCLDNILRWGIKNGYFISTNATSTFRSIVSSYPGELVLVSIQCPNPNFNKPEHRWRMVQRTLVEAVIDLLTTNGKVFLQSDIEEVVTRMKEQFLMYGKGKLAVDGDDGRRWIKENPFGVRSDWEQHVVDRGAPMYRVLIRKVNADRNI